MEKHNNIIVSIRRIPSEKRLSKNVLINEELPISCSIFNYFNHSTLLKRHPTSSI